MVVTTIQKGSGVAVRRRGRPAVSKKGDELVPARAAEGACFLSGTACGGKSFSYHYGRGVIPLCDAHAEGMRELPDFRGAVLIQG